MSRSSDFSSKALARVLFHDFGLKQDCKILLAYSGGCDSQVLLHALVKIRQTTGLTLCAAHFDHVLQPDSQDWVEKCKSWCVELDVPLVCHRQPVVADTGSSIEAVAREARYRWLDSISAEYDCIVTAHHADDQAETLLLALFQGRGFEQLQGIHLHRPLIFGSDSMLVRPLLGFRKAAIKKYAEIHDLRWIDDPSNQDTRFYRNYIRSELTPVLQKTWPGYVAKLNELALVVRVVCDQDSAATKCLYPGLVHKVERTLFCTADPLDAEKLSRLPIYQIENILKYWIYSAGLALPSVSQFEKCCAEISCAQFSRTDIDTGRIAIQWYAGYLYLRQNIMLQPGKGVSWDIGEKLLITEFEFEVEMGSSTDSGLDPKKLAGQKVNLRWRKGGEKIRLPGKRQHTPLKKLLQGRKIPPWERDYLPIIEVNGKIAWVYKIGPTAEFANLENYSGISPIFNHRKIETSARI